MPRAKKVSEQAPLINWPSAVLKSFREAYVIVVIAVGLFMILALLSFDPTDSAVVSYRAKVLWYTMLRVR